MRHDRRWTLILLAAAMGVLPVWAEDAEILPARQLHRGMKGHGLTVFEGTRIEKFDVEVIDVLRNVWPHQDMILIRVAHPVTDKAGIIGGMSGSPIYIEGKLIGALAYGWSWSKDPIAGVTPIRNMLEEMQRPREQVRTGPRRPGTGGPEPCPTPVFVSGLGSRGLEALRETLAPWGLSPMEGPGGGAEVVGNVELVPGAAIGVQMARGDIDLTAVGTVTYREGDCVLAFGHPYFSGGEHPLPITTAWIHTVLPSVARSFKFGSALETVGALVQDRQAAIVGLLGKRAPMIPVELTVRNDLTGVREDFHFEVLDHVYFTPSVLSSALVDIAEVTEDAMSPARIQFALDAEFEEFGSLHVEESFPMSRGIMTSRPLSALGQVLRTDLARVHLKSVRLNVAVRHEDMTARILATWPEEDEVPAGGTARIHVRLRPYRGDPFVEVVEVPMPKDLAGDTVTVRLQASSSLAPELPKPTTVPQLLRLLEADPPAQGLAVVVERPSVDLRIGGTRLRRLPASCMGPWIPNITEEEAEVARETQRTLHPMEWFLIGSDEVRIRVVPEKDEP